MNFPPASKPSFQKALEGWSILVVDDEPDNLDVARRMLTKAGAHILIAESGQQALDLLKTHFPHFIISDLSMPGMDGWGLLAALKSDPRSAPLPVIALTAHVMGEDRSKALNAGFINYITKPLDVSRFVAQVVQIIAESPEFNAVRKLQAGKTS